MGEMETQVRYVSERIKRNKGFLGGDHCNPNPHVGIACAAFCQPFDLTFSGLCLYLRFSLYLSLSLLHL